MIIPRQFGFTGTPIFPQNALGAETTSSVFGRVTIILLSSLSRLRFKPAVLSDPLTLSGEKRW
jgi:hypothetical protein